MKPLDTGSLRLIWHEYLVSRQPLTDYIPFCGPLCQKFPFSPTTAALEDGHCSSPKPVNSWVPQGFVLSSTLFLIFIKDPTRTHQWLYLPVPLSKALHSLSSIILSTLLMQELTFITSPLSLVNLKSLPYLVLPPSYYLNYSQKGASRQLGK